MRAGCLGGPAESSIGPCRTTWDESRHIGASALIGWFCSDEQSSSKPAPVHSAGPHERRFACLTHLLKSAERSKLLSAGNIWTPSLTPGKPLRPDERGRKSTAGCVGYSDSLACRFEVDRTLEADESGRTEERGERIEAALRIRKLKAYIYQYYHQR
ncbi:hypothetical protein BD289DRAFT_434069 [Coniella lustricola]|uniref:Uncharacterized protein n=1 Tax=Coniella lustricola TaxID=2025994 RepID=A0A2T3A7Y5_9PEZI|nr:hypothetical protein BD289DRAFT_434069 [Coniella lustricola]